MQMEEVAVSEEKYSERVVEATPVLEKGCLVALRTGIWGARCRMEKDGIIAPSSSFEPTGRNGGYAEEDTTSGLVNVDQEFWSANKYLIDHAYIRPMFNLRNKAWRYLYSKSITVNIDGVVFVPTEWTVEIDETLCRFQEKFFALVDDFVREYPSYVAEAKVKLTEKYFDATQYPSNESIRNKFKFEWLFFSFSMPGKEFGILSPEKYKKAESSFNSMMNDVMENATLALRNEFMEVLGKLSDMTTGPIPQRFHKSSLKKAVEFVDRFKALNLSDDMSMEKLVSDMKNVIVGVDTSDLKKDERFRQAIGKKVSEVKGQLTSLMTSTGARKLII